MMGKIVTCVFVATGLVWVEDKKEQPKPIVTSEMREQLPDGTYGEPRKLTERSSETLAYQQKVESTLTDLAAKKLGVSKTDIQILAYFNETADELSVTMVIQSDVPNLKERVKVFVEQEMLTLYPKLSSNRIAVTDQKNEFLY